MAFLLIPAAGAYLAYKIFGGSTTDISKAFHIKIQFHLGKIFDGVFSLLDGAIGIAKSAVDSLLGAASKAKEFLDGFLSKDVFNLLENNRDLSGAFAGAAAMAKNIVMTVIDTGIEVLSYANRMLDKINDGVESLKTTVVEVHISVKFEAQHKKDVCENHPGQCIGIECECYQHKK